MYQLKLSGYYWAVVVAVGGYIGRYDWEARAMGRGLHVTPDTPLRWSKALMLTAVNLSYNIFSNLASGWGLRGVVPTGAGLNELVVERYRALSI